MGRRKLRLPRAPEFTRRRCVTLTANPSPKAVAMHEAVKAERRRKSKRARSSRRQNRRVA